MGRKAKLRKILDKAIAEAVKIPVMKRNPGPKAMKRKTKKSTKKKPRQKVKKKAKLKLLQKELAYTDEHGDHYTVSDIAEDMHDDPKFWAGELGEPDLEDDIRDDPEYHAERYIKREMQKK